MSDTILLHEPEAPEVPRRRPPSRWGMVLAVILLAALALTVAGVFPLRQLVDQRRAVTERRAELARLIEENTALEEEIALLQTDEELERLAREDLGYVRPGEVGYVVVTPEGTPPVPIVEEATSDPEPTGDDAGAPWWVRAWRFVTGADLAGDG